MRRFFRVPTTNLTDSVDDNEVTLKILIYLDIFIAVTLRYALEMAEHETPPMSTIIHI